jgi:hypothetical protein
VVFNATFNNISVISWQKSGKSSDTLLGNHLWEVHRRCHREKWRRIFKQIQRIKWIVGENRFLYRGIKYNIFGFIPKTSYVHIDSTRSSKRVLTTNQSTIRIQKNGNVQIVGMYCTNVVAKTNSALFTIHKIQPNKIFLNINLQYFVFCKRSILLFIVCNLVFVLSFMFISSLWGWYYFIKLLYDFIRFYTFLI